jgi:hypothetical protein
VSARWETRFSAHLNWQSHLREHAQSENDAARIIFLCCRRLRAFKGFVDAGVIRRENAGAPLHKDFVHLPDTYIGPASGTTPRDCLSCTLLHLGKEWKSLSAVIRWAKLKVFCYRAQPRTKLSDACSGWMLLFQRLGPLAHGEVTVHGRIEASHHLMRQEVFRLRDPTWRFSLRCIP